MADKKRNDQQLHGIILAFDGIIVRTSRAIPLCTVAACEAIDLACAERDVDPTLPLLENLRGIAERQRVAVLARDRRRAAEVFGRRYREIVARQPAALVPGITEVLRRCTTPCSPRSGVSRRVLALVTPNPIDLPMIARSLGLTGLIDACVDGRFESASPADEAPNAFRHAANELACAPCSCIGVDVSPHGIRMIRSAGIAALGVRTTLATSDALGAAGAELIVPATSDLRTSAETAHAGFYSRSGGYGGGRRSRGPQRHTLDDGKRG